MDNEETMKRKEYLDRHTMLVQMKSEEYRTLDRTLLALSSGAIALSVTFISKIDVFVCIDLLIVSWISWTISIFLQLFSHTLGIEDIKSEIKILSDEYRDDTKCTSHNSYSRSVVFVNTISMVMFGVGALSFLVFVSRILLV